MRKAYIFGFLIISFLFFEQHVNAQQSNLSCSMINVPFINSSTPSFTVTGTPSASGLSFWSNAGRVVDNSTSNFATGTIAITGGLTYNVSDASNTYAAGNYVGFVIKSGLLSLSALGSITISTYNGSTQQETFSSSSLIAVNSAITGAYDIGFYTNKPFTSIQLNISDALGLSTYDVYYAFVRGTGSCTSPALICNNFSNAYFPRFAAVIDPSRTGTSGISLTALINEERVIDTDTDNYATITTVASAVGQVFIAVKDVTTDYPAGTFAGFDMENNTLLSTGVFNNVSIKTYRDGVLKESFSGSNLLLGANLFSGSARQRVGFVVDSSFDEVQLVINQPLAISLGTTKVYNAVFKKFCAGDPLACNTPTNIADSLQPVYINGAATNITGAVCGSCAITQTGNVIDGSDATHANINLSAGVLVTASLSVKNAIATYPAGTFAGFDIKSSSLLDLSLLNNFAIKTYRNDTLQENISGSSLFVGASSSLIGGNSRMVLGIAATKAFDEMRLVVNQPVSVSLGTIEVYNAILTNFCDNPLGCRTTNVLNNPDFPVYIDQQKSGLSGLACLGCSVDNANRVITADSSDFATITMVAGGGSTGSIAVKTAGSVFPAKSFAGFTVREMNGLLKLNFLKSIQITTYKGGGFRESRTAGSLLDLTLLFPILGGSQGKTVLGFATTKDYDEVQISVTSLIGVAPIVRVYNAFIGTHNVDSITSSILCPKSPNAEPDHLSVNVNSPLHGTVSTNDKDPNSGVLKYNPTLPVGPTHGTVVMDTNGNFSYTPDSNFIGVDSFKYSVCNAASLCTTAWAYVSVVPNPGTTNHAPIAQTDNGQTLTNSPLRGNLSSNDVDPDGDSLSYTNVSNVKHGTLTVNTDGSYTYVPDSSFVGTDTAINQVCDNGTPSICVNSLLIIQVNPMLDSPSANHPPYAQDDVASIQANHPLTGNVLNNDSDPDGDSLNTTFLDTVPPAVGSFVPTATGGYTFVPAPNYTGTVAVRYAACDGGTPAKCDTATLSITVTSEKTLCIKPRVYLEGSLYNNGNAIASDGRPLMRDDLRDGPTGQNYIPVKDPYEFAAPLIPASVLANKYVKMAPQDNAHPQFQQVTDSATVFGVSGQNAIVDWVFVELRSKSNNASVMATRAALIQRDGDIVDVDGQSCVSFPSIAIDSYYVAIRHRSHLGTMTKYAIAPDTLRKLVDFSVSSTQLYDKGIFNGFNFAGMSQKDNVRGSYRAMWQGDIDVNGKIKYDNPSSDNSRLYLSAVYYPANLLNISNYNVGYGYIQGDWDMNSKVKFDNPGADKTRLYLQVLFYPVNTLNLSNFNYLIQQLP